MNVQCKDSKRTKKEIKFPSQSSIHLKRDRSENLFNEKLISFISFEYEERKIPSYSSCHHLDVD